MPNYVQNYITVSGDEKEIEKMKEFIFTKKEDVEIFFDFNKVIPMPESLNMTSGSIETRAISIYMSSINPMTNIEYEKVSPEKFGDLLSKVEKTTSFFDAKMYFLSPEQLPLASKKYGGETPESLQELGKKYVQNLEKYGATTWYGWCTSNWGTKWNSNGSHWDDISGELSFETAWTAPVPVILKLSEMYPNLTFNHSYADEDFGSNVGELEIKAGKIIAENCPECQSTEAIALAGKILGESPESYGFELIEGEYKYVGCDDEDEEDEE